MLTLISLKVHSTKKHVGISNTAMPLPCIAVVQTDQKLVTCTMQIHHAQAQHSACWFDSPIIIDLTLRETINNVMLGIAWYDLLIRRFEELRCYRCYHVYTLMSVAPAEITLAGL